MVHYPKRKKVSGVPKGYTHNWAYRGHWKETKVSPTLWKIKFKATKNKKSSKYGGFKKGFKVHWKINADQIATKTSKGQYQTILTGTKKLVHSGNKKKFNKDHKKYKKMRKQY